MDVYSSQESVDFDALIQHPAFKGDVRFMEPIEMNKDEGDVMDISEQGDNSDEEDKSDGGDKSDEGDKRIKVCWACAVAGKTECEHVTEKKQDLFEQTCALVGVHPEPEGGEPVHNRKYHDNAKVPRVPEPSFASEIGVQLVKTPELVAPCLHKEKRAAAKGKAKAAKGKAKAKAKAKAGASKAGALKKKASFKRSFKKMAFMRRRAVLATSSAASSREAAGGGAAADTGRAAAEVAPAPVGDGFLDPQAFGVPKELFPQGPRKGKLSYTVGGFNDQGQPLRIEVLLKVKAFYLKRGPEGWNGQCTVAWGLHGGIQATWQHVKKILGGWNLQPIG